ncbi:MAG: acetyl-CoA carboxylase biotin carboxylase subunit [bacterium]|nr:acetyl-CoA carboxylase biotin carboxylase subunit [bacterium]
MFKKLLIANRGEIAMRILRTCREMGITAVSVYSDSDRLAMHVTYADESYHIGPSTSKDSYLNIDRIIGAAKASGAEAIHPGYGFLAESADFAVACKKAGITFIGPSPESIRRMGNKLEARATMKASGVRVIPGSDATIDSTNEVARVANSIGYPVMIKAAAGGGGKGLRLVRNKKECAIAIELTMSEAEHAFGDPSVFVEKYIERAKHIEVQLVADTHGKVVAVGERECSMQRRYQKVVEETPSPSITPELRAELCDAAVKAARAVDYVGAGTVEFIMGEDKTFFFLEMNTRLQVEHPVTEMVYGIDLVKEQIRIASREPLSVSPETLTIRGHAIEARIYAEDPKSNFLPSAGRVYRLVLPQGPGVRNENSIYPGYEIPVYYDPMIGKVIVWGEDRPTAIRRCLRALAEYQLDGVKTNLEFLTWAVESDAFADGLYDTGFIEREFSPDSLSTGPEDIELATIAASITAYKHARRLNIDSVEITRENVWRRIARMEGLRNPRM